MSIPIGMWKKKELFPRVVRVANAAIVACHLLVMAIHAFFDFGREISHNIAFRSATVAIHAFVLDVPGMRERLHRLQRFQRFHDFGFSGDVAGRAVFGNGGRFFIAVPPVHRMAGAARVLQACHFERAGGIRFFVAHVAVVGGDVIPLQVFGV